MTGTRLWHSFRMAITRGGAKRAEYCRRKDLFHYVGEKVHLQFRKIPLYPKLISFHNNVKIASNVTFITHDIAHYMLNEGDFNTNTRFGEHLGAIEIMDNVFIGANSTILYNVRIGPNVIVGAGSVVTRDLEPNSVYVGVPAKRLCSLSEYISKRIDANDQDVGVIQKQKITGSTEEIVWAAFINEREN